MKKILTVICCSVCCGFAAAQGTYSLEQLKQLAVENNYNLRSARNAIQQSKEQKSEALTKYFPTVSATGLGLSFDKHLINIDLGLPAGLASLIPAGLEIPSEINMIALSCAPVHLPTASRFDLKRRAFPARRG